MLLQRLKLCWFLYSHSTYTYTNHHFIVPSDSPCTSALELYLGLQEYRPLQEIGLFSLRDEVRCEGEQGWPGNASGWRGSEEHLMAGLECSSRWTCNKTGSGLRPMNGSPPPGQMDLFLLLTSSGLSFIWTDQTRAKKHC